MSLLMAGKCLFANGWEPFVRIFDLSADSEKVVFVPSRLRAAVLDCPRGSVRSQVHLESVERN
ncbi:hypothetical protein BRCON_1985 [Candidatus Sumerlaea chitinivorans]|uniref:Uncharacterized protein n=1 Tax=Sumerlaea chitinivorans TaxID=2250252 RepID=A0A2Z4Y7Y4_SUMC1|nr:hypothetical protein BRCON_1985 [Candidatus Sumerlaea chitinivorans]